jgi:hypothetical protein
MDKCPPEICLIICTLATFADDGSTGCSLSLVSRYIHNVSKPVRLQSVSIRHLDNLLAFAKVLETSPPKLRRVRHLFFSTHDQSAGPDRRNYIHDTRKLEDAHFSRELLMLKVVTQILEAITPTIESLHVVFLHRRRHPLLPVTFPNLTELSIYGPCPQFWHGHRPQPSLRRLHFTGTWCHARGLFRQVGHSAPLLTHLRVSGQQVEFDVGLAPDVRGILPLQPTMKRVLIQLGPLIDCLEYNNLQLSCEAAVRLDNRIAILKPKVQREHPLPVIEIIKLQEREWLERIDGGEGCWSEVNIVPVPQL